MGAIMSGMAECVVVFRALAQGQFGRFGQGAQSSSVSGNLAHTVPYGLLSPAHMFAMKYQRFAHDHARLQIRQRDVESVSGAGK